MLIVTKLEVKLEVERIEKAALSKIADILSDNAKSPIVPEIDIWKKIFNNAEQEELFESIQGQLVIKIERIGRDEENLYHNEKTYNALLNAFMELIQNYGELLKLLNGIAHKFHWARLLDYDKLDKIKEKDRRYKEMDETDYFETLNSIERKKVFDECSLKTYRDLRANLNVLGLEIDWFDEQFSISPLAERNSNKEEIVDAVAQWLSVNYIDVYNSLFDSRKAYVNGDAVGCVTHCRNIITGIASVKKDDAREWYSGLQKICRNDKNIAVHANPKNIPNIKYNAHSTDLNERYQYPRFNLVNKLYVMTCALGAHINEGNIIGGVVDSEDVSMEDALWILRSTEDFLIWLMQSGNMN